MSESTRDHLFISYAGEDGAFAEWLTLRLTTEGYRVWCDRIKLLGGESYPKDIDEAIKTSTYRLLAVMSRHSVSKDNPVKERVLALNLGRKRGEKDFVIPLNLDGLAPTDLDWMTSDITFIPFHQGWADGLARLLKKLSALDAPRPLGAGGPAVASEWANARDGVVDREERLWANVLPVRALPDNLLRVNSQKPNLDALLREVPHYRENDHVMWVFELPEEQGRDWQVKEVAWAQPHEFSDLDLRRVVPNLLRQYLHALCIKRGLRSFLDSRGRGQLYFPFELGKAGRISFESYSGRKTPLKVAGARSFRIGGGAKEKTRYHLAPVFTPNVWLFERPVILLRLSLLLTDTSGKPLDSAKALRRRKKICKSWWNHQWLTRLMAVTQWLANGQDDLDLSIGASGSIVVRFRPTQHRVPVGIDERELEPLEFDEDAMLDDSDEDDPDTDSREGPHD